MSGSGIRLAAIAGVGFLIINGQHAHHHKHHGTGASLLSYAAVPYSGGYSSRTWARAFLKGAGLPRTGCNVSAVEAWQRAEGTYGSYRNPLDTTQRAPGSHSVNSVGVQKYVSWRQGLHASAVTLGNGYYPGIIAALRAGNDAQRVATAVQESRWGTGPFTAGC